MNAKPPNADLAAGRRESIAILGATLIGAGLRLWHLDRVGLTHFDEGIYALTGLWSVQPGGLTSFSRSSIPYAPPGFPILVGLSYLLFGVADLSPILVSIAVGSLTIPLVGWLGRRSFGPSAGAIGAGLGAISGAHATFSRMALTDVSFLFCWIMALALGGRFLERPTVGRSIALGLSVGLAQNFKYNGWLSGVVVALAALPMLGRGKGTLKLLGLLSIAGGLSALSYVPWYRFVEAHRGGYAALLRHHSGYLQGIESWPSNLWSQLGQSAALSGGPAWGVGAWSLGWIGGCFAAPARTRSRRRWIAEVGGGVGGGVLLATVPAAPWWLALAAIPWLLVDSRPAARVIAFSWLALAILTPFYHPYSRLWLPSTAASWLIVGGGAAELMKWSRAVDDRPSGRKLLALSSPGARGIASIVGLAVAVGSAVVPSRRPIPIEGLLDPSDSLRSGVAEVQGALESPGGPVVLLGRPQIVFCGFLRRLIFARIEGLSDLDAAGGRLALLEEAQLRQEGEPSAILARLDRRWEVVGTFPVIEGIVSMLDDRPGAAFDRGRGRRSHLWLVRRRTGAPNP